jgi:hypothetical protein
MVVSFNIGYDLGGWAVLSPFPVLEYCDNVRELTTRIRESVTDLYDWAIQSSVPPETMRLYLVIHEDGLPEKKFIIRSYYIREYKEYLETKKGVN